jgi:capsid protein
MPPVKRRRGFLDRLAAAFRALGYDAAEGSGKRRAPSGLVRSEDAELTPDTRRKLLSQSRDLQRNFTLAGWMVRKHLDYVSTFEFQSRTGDRELDRTVERWMRAWSRAGRCDVTGRHSLAKLIRLAEARRTIDGDVLVVRLANGQLQVVEGDRIRTPYGRSVVDGFTGLADDIPNASEFLHGVRTSPAGRPLEYAICRRGRASDFSSFADTFFFERIISAENAWLHGYFQRFDQIRGIAPLAPAINTLQDCYEGCDYALAKMKIGQLFGLAMFRQQEDPLGTSAEGDDGRIRIDFGTGPIVLDLDKEDRAEFLEAKSPSTEFQAWSSVMLGIAFKGLDIPFSFYAENFTNFSGQRQAWIQYDLSAKSKRADNQSLLDEITLWRLGLAIADGELPEFDLSDLPWDWISVGVPWIDPLKEVNADIAAIGAGLSSRTRVLREQGLDFESVALEIAAENAYLVSLGLPTTTDAANTQIVEVAPSAN